MKTLVISLLSVGLLMAAPAKPAKAKARHNGAAHLLFRGTKAMSKFAFKVLY